MTALNKQALREKIKNKREFFDTQTIIDVDVLEALLDELEKEKGYASAFEAEKWHYHGLAESEGERADRAEKALEAAERLITEWEQRELSNKRQLVINGLCESGEPFWEIDDYMKKWDAEHPREAAAAGIGVKGE